MDSILELISDYSLSISYSDLPKSSVRSVKHRLIDSLGCALGGFLGEPCKIAKQNLTGEKDKRNVIIKKGQDIQQLDLFPRQS